MRGFSSGSWFRYKPLNTLSVEEGGVDVARTESATPPPDRFSYALGLTADASQARPEFPFTLFLPRAPARGPGLSEIHLTETDATQARATSTLHLTFVEPGGCAIQSLAAEPPQTPSGQNVVVSWHAVHCKRIQLYRQQPGSVVSGSGEALEYEETAQEAEHDFEGSRTVRTMNVGGEGYRLVATSALGESKVERASVEVTQPAQPPPPPPEPCSSGLQSFASCVSCPGLEGGPLHESETTVSACTEADATASVQQANPGCSVTTGGFRSIAVCVRCANGETFTEEPRACTDAGALAVGLARHASGCTATTGSCSGL